MKYEQTCQSLYTTLFIHYSEPSPIQSPSKRSSSNRGRKRKRAKDDFDYEPGQYQRKYSLYSFVIYVIKYKIYTEEFVFTKILN